jgi:hypothetical protein
MYYTRLSARERMGLLPKTKSIFGTNYHIQHVFLIRQPIPITASPIQNKYSFHRI